MQRDSRSKDHGGWEALESTYSPARGAVAVMRDKSGDRAHFGPGVRPFVAEQLPFHPTSRVDENSCSATEWPSGMYPPEQTQNMNPEAVSARHPRDKGKAGSIKTSRAMQQHRVDFAGVGRRAAKAASVTEVGRRAGNQGGLACC